MPATAKLVRGAPRNYSAAKLFGSIWTSVSTQHHGVEPILSDGSTLSILAGIALGPSDLALEVIDRHHETPSSIFSIRAQGSQ